MKNKIIVLFICIILLSSVSIQGQSALKKQVDSLFVIASSGELKYRDLIEPTIIEIADLGEVVVPILVDKLDTKSARERLTVINILKKIGSPAVPFLITSLKNPNGLIVQRVCWALGEIKDSSAVDALMGVSNHARWQVRDQAIGALGDIADNKAADVILLAMRDEIGQVRKAVGVSCGKMKILEAVPKLVHLLGDDFYGARMSAKEALLKIDTSYVVALLADSLYSDNSFVRSLGCEILGIFANDQSINILHQTFLGSTGDLRLNSALAILMADPQNLCGYQTLILNAKFDKYAKLKIQSVLRIE